jgi:hypothetical protein
MSDRVLPEARLIKPCKNAEGFLKTKADFDDGCAVACDRCEKVIEDVVEKDWRNIYVLELNGTVR